MDYTALRNALWYGNIALEVVLLVRLLRLELWKRYAVFVVYLSFEVIRGSVLAWLLQTSKGLYGWVYLATLPVTSALSFLLVLELYSQMLEEFPGIRRLGRLVLFSALISVTLAICLLMAWDQQMGFDYYPLLSYLTMQQRSVFLALSALTLLLLVFVAHYRLSIRRNVWILCACFGSFFVVNALLFALRRHFGVSFAPLRDLIAPLCSSFALLGAVLFLSKAGESESRPLSVVWGMRNRELESALSSQLQGLNQALVRVLRP